MHGRLWSCVRLDTDSFSERELSQLKKLLSFSTVVSVTEWEENKAEIRAFSSGLALHSSCLCCVLFTVSFCAVVSGMGSNGCLLQPSPSEKKHSGSRKGGQRKTGTW